MRLGLKIISANSVDKYKLKIISENITYTINKTKNREIDSKLLYEIRSRLNIIKEDIKKII
tara:strand:- start:959 stop:1141 length:183 start_codon:yes stop_codon:yes gene_type:complete